MNFCKGDPTNKGELKMNQSKIKSLPESNNLLKFNFLVSLQCIANILRVRSQFSNKFAAGDL